MLRRSFRFCSSSAAAAGPTTSGGGGGSSSSGAAALLTAFAGAERKPVPEQWTATATKELKGSRERVEKLTLTLPEGFQQKPIYTAADIKREAPLPGQFPYTRGVHASMYTAKPWTVRQYAGFSTAEESNRFYKANLAAGQQGISVLAASGTPCLHQT